jgi:hypothetical protein
MPIKIVCPKCNANLQVPDAMAGKQGKCKCGTVLSIPAVAAAAVAKPAQSKPANAPAGAKPVAAARPAAPVSTSARNVGSLFDEITATDMGQKAVVPKPDAVPTKKSESALLKKFTASDDYVAGNAEEKEGRPGVLIVLSILNFIASLGGLGLAIVGLVATAALSQAAETVPLLRLSGLIVALGFVMFAFSVTMGIGLLTRIQAFWWIGVTMYAINLCFGVTDAVFDLVMPLQSADTNVAKVYGKIAGSVVIGILILYNLYSPRVRKWFSIKISSQVVFAITFGIALLIGCGGAFGTRRAMLAEEERAAAEAAAEMQKQ